MTLNDLRNDRADLRSDATAAPPPTGAGLPLAARPVAGTGDGLLVPGAGTLLPGVAVTAVTAGDGALWVLGDRRDLYRLNLAALAALPALPADGAGGAGDATAAPVAGLAPPDTGVCLAVHAGRVWVGGDRAGLWVQAGDRLEPVASFQEAPSRDRWTTPWGGPPSVFSMAAHGDDLYVNVHVGGIIRTSDGGRTWQATIDPDVDVHHVAVDGGGRLWAANGDGGLAGSADRGVSWQVHEAGLHGRYLTAVAPTADGVLVAAASGHGAGDGALYRFDPATRRFEPCGGDLPSRLGGIVAPRHLAAAGDEALVAAPGGDVYASGDGGRSWRLLAGGLERIGEVALVPAVPAGDA